MKNQISIITHYFFMGVAWLLGALACFGIVYMSYAVFILGITI